jgi:hypothetical protein
VGNTKGHDGADPYNLRHIPWNRPLYEHLGFRALSGEEIGSGLRAVCDAEAEHGLDPDLRVVMRLDLNA